MKRLELTAAQAAHLRALNAAAKQAQRELELVMTALVLALVDKPVAVSFDLDCEQPFLEVPDGV